MATALIIGAGINGLCTARALVLRGWDVTVLETGPLPNPHAASWDHHRMIRSQYAGKPGYAARMGDAFAAWDRLWHDLGCSHYIPRGVIALSRAAGDWTDRARQAYDQTDVSYKIIEGSALHRRFVHLVPDGVRYALHMPGGALMSAQILDDLLQWLGARGVNILGGHHVTEIAGNTVVASQGLFHADRIIVTAGVGLRHLSPWFAGATHARRSTVVYADPPPNLRTAWAEAPAWVDLGGEDDLWGLPAMNGLGVKLGYGLHTRAGDPATDRDVVAADTTQIMAAYQGRFAQIEQFIPRETIVNFYLMAPNEDFVFRDDGPVLWLSADSGHGFKFGALTGEDAADALELGADHVAARYAPLP